MAGKPNTGSWSSATNRFDGNLERLIGHHAPPRLNIPADWAGIMSAVAKAVMMSDKQVVSVIALIFAALVAGALYLNLIDWNQHPSAVPAAQAASETFDCSLRSVQDPRFDVDACYDRVQRKYQIGPYVPWYRQHPALAAIAAGGATFFILAGGARLFLE